MSAFELSLLELDILIEQELNKITLADSILNE